MVNRTSVRIAWQAASCDNSSSAPGAKASRRWAALENGKVIHHCTFLSLYLYIHMYMYIYMYIYISMLSVCIGLTHVLLPTEYRGVPNGNPDSYSERH